MTLILEKWCDFRVFKCIPKVEFGPDGIPRKGWVFCRSLRLPNDHRYLVTAQLKNHVGLNGEKPTTKDLLEAISIFCEFEKELVREEYQGWKAECPYTNTKMLKLFDSFGAKEYKIDEFHCVWFKKDVEAIKAQYSELNVRDRVKNKLMKEQ